MHSNSNLSRGNGPLVLRTAAVVLSFLGPLVRLLQKSAINHPDVPAAALAKMAFDTSLEGSEKEVYFVLDDQVGFERIQKAMEQNKDEAFDKVLKDSAVSSDLLKQLTA
jgi:hypothetical protein